MKNLLQIKLLILKYNYNWNGPELHTSIKQHFGHQFTKKCACTNMYINTENYLALDNNLSFSLDEI